MSRCINQKKPKPQSALLIYLDLSAEALLVVLRSGIFTMPWSYGGHPFTTFKPTHLIQMRMLLNC